MVAGFLAVVFAAAPFLLLASTLVIGFFSAPTVDVVLVRLVVVTVTSAFLFVPADAFVSAGAMESSGGGESDESEVSSCFRVIVGDVLRTD